MNLSFRSQSQKCHWGKCCTTCSHLSKNVSISLFWYEILFRIRQKETHFKWNFQLFKQKLRFLIFECNNFYQWSVFHRKTKLKTNLRSDSRRSFDKSWFFFLPCDRPSDENREEIDRICSNIYTGLTYIEAGVYIKPWWKKAAIGFGISFAGYKAYQYLAENWVIFNGQDTRKRTLLVEKSNDKFIVCLHNKYKISFFSQTIISFDVNFRNQRKKQWKKFGQQTVLISEMNEIHCNYFLYQNIVHWNQ